MTKGTRLDPDVGQLQIQVKALKAQVQDLEEEKARREYADAVAEEQRTGAKVRALCQKITRAFWASSRRHLANELFSATRDHMNAEARLRETGKKLPPPPSLGMSLCTIGSLPKGLQGALIPFQQQQHRP